MAGDGWGALAALESVGQAFVKIIVVTTDPDVQNFVQVNGYNTESNIFDVEADLYICAGYKRIIAKDFLKNRRVINLHYSLLPKYRGMHSTVWAILNNEKKLGLSIHEMNEDIDDGPIIKQYEIDYVNETARDIMEKCNQYVRINLGGIVRRYLNGEIEVIEQDLDEATWVCKRNLDDCLISFEWDIGFLKLFFKALVSPYPLPRIEVREELYEVLNVEFIERDYVMTNGRVVNIDKKGVWVKISGGLIIFNDLKVTSTGEVISAKDLFKIGARL